MPRDEEPAPEPIIDWARFDGLYAPTYTQTPDAIFDWIAPFISCTELRVLLYITRRTFGFKKLTDAISVDQMCHGIVTREGRRLDYGTQLKRATVLAAVKGLREKSLILTHHQSDADGGSRPTLYSLNIKQDPRDHMGGIPSFIQENTPGATAKDQGSPSLQTPGVYPYGPGGSRSMDAGVHEQRLQGPPLRTGGVSAPGRRESTSVDTQQTAIQHTDLQERDHSKSSRGTPPDNMHEGHEDGPGHSKRTRIYSARISEVARELSTLFHDHAHEQSNRTRALRLWADSGLDDDLFVDMMYESRRVAQARGNIARAATDGSIQGTKNRMPYFFSVLERLLHDTVEA